MYFFKVSQNSGFGLQVFVKSVRIRCIKSDSSRVLTTEQKKYYDDYAEQIEEYANGDPERREAAFTASEIPKFEFENDGVDNSRMSDLINAFNGLCEEEEKRVSARYDQFIDRNIVINHHSENDKRINYIKDFTKTKEIKLYRADQNLKELSPLISRLINLESLSISFNPELTDDGMPWEYLPEKLTMLDIGGTNIKGIPAKIKRLKVLKYFLCGNQVNYIKWKALPETLEELQIECGGRVNLPRSLRRFKNLGKFVLMNAGLKKRFFKHLKTLYRFVDLSGNNFKAFKCPNFSPEVSRIYLNNCQLSKVDWVDVWRVLPNLEQLQLRHNQLTEIFPHPLFFEYSLLTHLVLEENQIENVCGEFLPTSLTYLDLAKNKLSSFDFIDYLPNLVKDEKQKQPNEVKGRMILISDRSFKDTSRWQTSYKIHTYDFIPKHHHEEKLHGCNCCARCGTNCAKEIGQIETFMVMDFTNIVETPSNETRAEKEVIDEYGPGEWKTMIKTKMCFECLAKMRTEVAEFYNEMPLKHKINATKNKNIEPANASTGFPQPGVQPSALIPVMDNKCDDNIFSTSKIQEINYHLQQQHYQHDITMASFPPQLSEQYVQMDNTNIMYIHPLDTVNPQTAYIYSTPVKL
uniref:Uncharacterized protein n=1 Tax=Panagrolaimus sp. ES5 TaxID=591445 RepID=A0AC34FQH3_9BILA